MKRLALVCVGILFKGALLGCYGQFRCDVWQVSSSVGNVP